MSANDMSFLHLSDPHIERQGEHYWGVQDGYLQTQRVLDHMREYGGEPAFCLITGDLVQDDGAAYPRLKEMVEKFQAAFNVPVLLALGNGDVIGPFRQFVLGEVNPNPNQRYYYSQIINGLKIIVLDSHSEKPRLHDGQLDEVQLEWLRNELTVVPEMDHLIALHHMPGPVVASPYYHHELRNASELAEIITGHNIIGILAGHQHTAYMTTFAGIPCAIANGICNALLWSYSKRQHHYLVAPGYNLVHIRDRKMLVQFIDLPGDKALLQATGENDELLGRNND